MENCVDLTKITKSIGFSKNKNSKGQISYRLKLELINGSSTELFVNKDDIELIGVLKSFGHEEPIKSKQLVEVEREDGKKYYSINITLADDTLLMYYNFSFNFQKIISLVRSNYEKNKK